MEIYGQLSTKYRSEKSYNGYTLDVLKSALQKYIRRCNPEMAIYAAAELDLFSFDPKGERIRTNLIHRLMIIFMEDVYNPNLWPLIDHLIFNLLSLRDGRKDKDVNSPIFCEKRREEIDAICRIVYSLSTSPHSRENSYYKYVLFLHFLAKPQIAGKLEKRFPFLIDIKKKKEIDFKPSNLPDFVKSMKKEVKEVKDILNFIGSLEHGDEMCIHYGHKIASWKESPIKFYNSKKPAYMIFYLIDFVLKSMKIKMQIPLVEIGKKWYKELNPIKEDFLCWQTVLLFILKKGEYKEYKEDDKITSKLYKLYRKNLDQQKIEFDEWVYDMHTRIGKIKGKGSEYFATESSFVCNEVKDINKKYKNVYIYSKILQESPDQEYKEDEDEEEDKEEKDKGQTDIRSFMKKREVKEEKKVKSVKKEIPLEQTDIRKFLKSKERSKEKSKEKSKENAIKLIKSAKEDKDMIVEDKKEESDKESEFFKFIVRAQLVCGNTKTDTYYAEHNGKLLFVKGPIDLDSVKPFMELQKVKHILGLPTLNYQIVFLKPDLFGKTPLGRRNKLDRSKIHPFIICDVLFDHTADNIPYRIHSSKLWPETKVVDFEKIKGMKHFDQ